jgi:hypothetical protein
VRVGVWQLALTAAGAAVALALTVAVVHHLGELNDPVLCRSPVARTELVQTRLDADDLRSLVHRKLATVRGDDVTSIQEGALASNITPVLLSGLEGQYAVVTTDAGGAYSVFFFDAQWGPLSEVRLPIQRAGSALQARLAWGAGLVVVWLQDSGGWATDVLTIERDGDAARSLLHEKRTSPGPGPIQSGSISPADEFFAFDREFGFSVLQGPYCGVWLAELPAGEAAEVTYEGEGPYAHQFLRWESEDTFLFARKIGGDGAPQWQLYRAWLAEDR